MFHIRREEPNDSSAIREIHEHAFGQPVEADLVDQLRTSCPDQLSLVAVDGDQLLGHILFTRAVIEYADGLQLNGMGLAPVAVLPEYQRQGIGSALVKFGLEQIRAGEQSFVIVLGHPEYYSRFGFEPASRFQISCVFSGENPDAFMINIFNNRGFETKKGIACYHPDFSLFS